MLVSIVIPCYNSEHTIGKVVELAIEEFEKLKDYECEFVLVNDYSRDGTWNAIHALAEKHPNVKGINLAKNFGQHNAIMAAMNHTEGDLIIGMDDDMQNHPSQIPLFLDKIQEGYDIVFGVFKERKFSAFKNLTGAVSRFLLWHLLDRPKDIQMSSFWCCRRYVRDEIVKYDGYNIFLQVLFFRTTHNIANIEIEHFEREVGTSNYNFRRNLSFRGSQTCDSRRPDGSADGRNDHEAECIPAAGDLPGRRRTGFQGPDRRETDCAVHICTGTRK